MNTKLARTFDIPDEQFRRIAWKIVVGCLKGGTAKSTSALLIAAEIHRRTGEKVLIVCADPSSQTMVNFYRRQVGADDGIEVPFHVITWHTHEKFAAGVLNEMRRLGCRHFVIDVGGGDNAIFQAACTIAEELIIPVTPNLVELERLAATFVSAGQVAHLNEVTPSVLLVKAAARSVKASNAVEEFDRMGWPVLESRIPYQAFYADAFEGGIPPHGGLYGSALAEIALSKLDDDTTTA